MTVAVTPVSYPFRWLLFRSKHRFCVVPYGHSTKYNNAALCLTPHQSALRLTASPQGEALGRGAPQAFPSRGRCQASARRMRWTWLHTTAKAASLHSAPQRPRLFVPRFCFWVDSLRCPQSLRTTDALFDRPKPCRRPMTALRIPLPFNPQIFPRSNQQTRAARFRRKYCRIACKTR